MSGDTHSLRSGQALTTTAKYVWEGNTHSASSGQAYYDPLLFALEGGAWKHPMYDGLGSTRQLLDNTTQNVTDEYAYEAFGNLMSSTGSTPNPYRYVGSLGYYQTGSSLQHLGARYYMPEIGRFLQRDPVTARAFDYLYGSNAPTIQIDPRGLEASQQHCDALYFKVRMARYDPSWLRPGNYACKNYNDRLYDYNYQCASHGTYRYHGGSRHYHEEENATYRKHCKPSGPAKSPGGVCDPHWGEAIDLTGSGILPGIHDVAANSLCVALCLKYTSLTYVACVYGCGVGTNMPGMIGVDPIPWPY